MLIVYCIIIICVFLSLKGCHESQVMWRRAEMDNIAGGHRESFMTDTDVDLRGNLTPFNKRLTLTSNDPVTAAQREEKKYYTGELHLSFLVRIKQDVNCFSDGFIQSSLDTLYFAYVVYLGSSLELERDVI